MVILHNFCRMCFWVSITDTIALNIAKTALVKHGDLPLTFHPFVGGAFTICLCLYIKGKTEHLTLHP